MTATATGSRLALPSVALARAGLCPRRAARAGRRRDRVAERVHESPTLPRTAHRRRAAATRCSSSPRATSGSRSSCATPTGTRCAPPAARSAGSIARQLETTLTEAGAAKTFRDIALDDYLRAASSSAPPGATSSRSRCSSSGPATSCSDTLSVEADARPGAGRVLGHQLLAREPARRALVATSASRRSSASASASSRTSRTRAWWRHAHQRQAGQRHRSACAIT